MKKIKCNIRLLTIFIFLALNLSCNLQEFNQSKKAVYLIPKDYLGPVVILFNQSDGITPNTENGFAVYKIPESGVLKVNRQAVYKIYQQKFFYVDSNGEREKIEYIYPSSQVNPSDKERRTFDDLAPDDNNTYAMGSEMGSFNSGNNVVQFRTFELGLASESSKLYQETRNKITKLQKRMPL